MTLVLESLNVGYGARVVLGAMTAVLPRGELTCLVGPNGAGKSTLLRTLAGLQRPLGGRVLLDGHDLAGLSRTRIAKVVSVVLTDRVDPGLLRVEDVVGIGRHPHSSWTGRANERDRRVVSDSLAGVHAASLAGQFIAALSDGQRQRVMIARALAQEPRVMLLDEPTSFLDPPGRISVFALLRTLARDRNLAVLVCTHDVEQAVRHADTVWAAAQGGLVTGSPEDLLAAGALATVFQQPGVTFDIESLTFQTVVDTTQTAAVNGSGVSAVLARHCLRRAGFVIVGEDENPRLTVSAHADHWRIGEARHDTLGALYKAAAACRDQRSAVGH